MAIEKNPKKFKKDKKNKADPLARKEWFDFKAPNPFDTKSFGKTLCTRTTGTKIASETIKGRVVEQSLTELQSSNERSWRKVRLVVEEVQGRNAKTSFHGLDITKDKLCSLFRKWQTTIETFVDVKTADGYILRVFTICFTKKIQAQKRKTTYAYQSQIKSIRRKINEILLREVAKSSINEVVSSLVLDSYIENIEKACKIIFPLQNIVIRKVKVLKKPRMDTLKLNELYAQKKSVGGNKEGDIPDESENLLTKQTKKENKKN